MSASRFGRLTLLWGLLLAAMLASGCKKNPYARQAPGDIVFLDMAPANAEAPADVESLEFVDTAGQKCALRDFQGRKNVVLVFTRGFSGALCPFCRTQTSRLITSYDQFESRDAEILLVYPGATGNLPEFLAAVQKPAEKQQLAKVPFPILLDENLTAVDHFGIRADLASPATYILDKQGRVRYAYVGRTIADRPSVRAMIDQLDLLEK